MKRSVQQDYDGKSGQSFKSETDAWKERKLLRRCLEIPVFGTLVYHMVVSRDAVNNEFIENYAFDPFHPTETCRMHIMRQRTEAAVMQRMFMQIRHPNI